jgi:hypothetical protein
MCKRYVMTIAWPLSDPGRNRKESRPTNRAACLRSWAIRESGRRGISASSYTFGTITATLLHPIMPVILKLPSRPTVGELAHFAQHQLLRRHVAASRIETCSKLIRSGWPVRRGRLPNKEWHLDTHRWRGDRDPSYFDGSATA